MQPASGKRATTPPDEWSARREGCGANTNVMTIPQCKVYVGETDNKSFGGGTPMAELADRIAFTAGPSGPNKVSPSHHSLQAPQA